MIGIKTIQTLQETWFHFHEKQGNYKVYIVKSTPLISVDDMENQF